jgi:carbonic anhydrase
MTLPASAENAPAFPERLIKGYRKFLDGRFSTEQGRYRELAEEGQKPRVLLIGCCDSRVSPEVIFDARPGEIFVVRNVANLAPPYAPNDDLHGTSAALEFAVMGLRVEHIVVMGHAGCGGVRAFAENEVNPYTRPLSPGDFIGKWVKLLAPAYERAGPLPHGDTSSVSEVFIEKLALESIKQSLQNLRTFPCVKTLEERGRLSLHGAYFGVMDGVLRVLNPETGQFERVG